MELIDRMNGLETEVNMVKSEIKKVLIDLRETMNTAENPFAHIEQLQHGGASSIDEERLKHLEGFVTELRDMSGGNSIDEERLKNLEDTIEQLRDISSNGNSIDEERLKNLEDTIEQLRDISSSSGVDEGRLKNLEVAIEQLRDVSSNGSGADEGRLKNLENAIEQLRDVSSNGSGADEGRLKNLEVALEELKEIGIGNGVDEEMIKKLEDSMQELNELGNVEVEKLKNLEVAIEKMGEAKTQSPPEEPLFNNRAASESELKRIGVGFGAEVGSVVTGDEIIDTLTLAQLIQWADSALNLLGMEKLTHVIGLYALTGRLSKEMKDTILKITELPAAYHNPEKEQVETKYCIIALLELDRILTGEHRELFTLLKELC